MEELQSISNTKMSKDIRAAHISLGSEEVRFLVDAYYERQADRIRNDARVRSMGDEPNMILGYLGADALSMENQIKAVLNDYTKSKPVGQWLHSITGIGPVISAGLMAHIDIEQAPTAGHIWSFAGIYGTGQVWEKGQKRPWNAALKTLCWKAGESFIKVSNNEKDVYGKLYKQKKDVYIAINEAGGYKERAAQILEGKKFGKTTEAYKSYIKGELPKGHIHAMARRYAVKIFLSHLHHVMYVDRYDTEPPKPFVIAHGGHTHIIPVPNF